MESEFSLNEAVPFVSHAVHLDPVCIHTAKHVLWKEPSAMYQFPRSCQLCGTASHSGENTCIILFRKSLQGYFT